MLLPKRLENTLLGERVALSLLEGDYNFSTE
jgi:hypothetical protein